MLQCCYNFSDTHWYKTDEELYKCNELHKNPVYWITEKNAIETLTDLLYTRCKVLVQPW
ncbi:hypothetical protein CRENPOLYSF2_370042 [Crenothrix polyspora]|uniref:Uncharacterized protein n=1 Tax=Crenothrix polyspora TaxID=360316 RepID=A0A1R4HCH3_9GAMM|nr:hypothetical protein CRENPOLYSF2_370042 [Crenothrix polyspora]